jgi:hypothetical protein
MMLNDRWKAATTIAEEKKRVRSSPTHYHHHHSDLVTLSQYSQHCVRVFSFPTFILYTRAVIVVLWPIDSEIRIVRAIQVMSFIQDLIVTMFV